MFNVLGRFSFLVGAGIAFFGALIHSIAPVIGPDWYAFLHAPKWVVTSAQNGTWHAPIGTAVVGTLMFACGIYALSGLGVIKRIPLTTPALWTISSICLLRGGIIFPLLIKVPEKLSGFDIVASLVWFAAGLSFFLGILGHAPKASKQVG
ncbi:hypothetical protein [Chitinimonas sp. BJYL2]|uniref:hypothetical protein n=1 Tax=Chitinimonas sp. BJYL2 TaxID=2976696 RepID=UPI0022B3E066|nr:hypothetical protein [Chitinimonas sp. BJYL2]